MKEISFDIGLTERERDALRQECQLLFDMAFNLAFDQEEINDQEEISWQRYGF